MDVICRSFTCTGIDDTAALDLPQQEKWPLDGIIHVAHAPPTNRGSIVTGGTDATVEDTDVTGVGTGGVTRS